MKVCIVCGKNTGPAQVRRGMIINSPGTHSSPVVRIEQKTPQWLKLHTIEGEVFGWHPAGS